MSQKVDGSKAESGWHAESERRTDADLCACAALRFLSDQLGYAVLVVSRDGRMLHANSAGWELMTGGSPFSLARNALQVQGVPAIQWMQALPNGTDRARCMVLRFRPPRSRQTTDYRIAVMHGALKRSADPYVFCVYTALAQRQIDTDVLRALYDLTPAEAATAAGVFGGHSLAELARMRATSIHTVRTQLKRTLLKCQVRSQIELCRLLATGPGVF